MTRRFHKTVDIAKIDEEERTATGYVLIPNELDHQADFFRPEAVSRFFNPGPQTGVMHAAFPEDAAETVESTIIDEPENDFPAGSWRFKRHYKDDELWGLVKDEIVSAFSIGGTVTEAVEHDSVPGDVRIPEGVELAEDEPVIELVDGQTDEISDVDLPAVPRATHKDELGKNILDETESKEEFIAVMQERGRTEDEAERLYQYLVSHTEEKTDLNYEQMTEDTPDDATKWQLFKGWLTGDEGDDAPDTVTLNKATLEDAAETLSKAGRPLNTHNRQALMAIHDAAESALASDVTFRTNRFTDNPQFGFDVAEYGKDNPSHPPAEEPEDDEDEETESAGDDKPDDEEDEDMTEDTDNDTEAKSDEMPEWAKSLKDDIEQLKNDDADDAEKTDETEEPPAWAKALQEEVETLKQQGGYSQQLDGGSATEKENEPADFGTALLGKIAAEAN